MSRLIFAANLLISLGCAQVAPQYFQKQTVIIETADSRILETTKTDVLLSRDYKDAASNDIFKWDVILRTDGTYQLSSNKQPDLALYVDKDSASLKLKTSGDRGMI